jgi:hypothetical protein
MQRLLVLIMALLRYGLDLINLQTIVTTTRSFQAI